MSDDIQNLLRLVRSNNLGPIGIKKLLERFSNLDDAIYALQADANLLGRKIELADLSDIDKELTLGQKLNAIPITILDEDYPQLLRKCVDAPPFLWLLGNKDILSKTTCAVVGSRNASVGGRKIAYSLGKALSGENFTTVSGLARGIDAAAHEGGISQTIAVLGGGVDNIYPLENKNLYESILKNNGAIISENALGSKPKANLFLRRNRIISGLSIAVVVVEAGLKSGSLATADLALSQNREVFSVPASPLEERASGTNKLLRNGASWAESSEDVLSYLRNLPQDANTIQKQELADCLKASLKIETLPISKNAPKDKNDFLSYFSTSPIKIDELIRISGKTSNEVMMLITEHEFLGDIDRLSGNIFTLSPKSSA